MVPTDPGYICTLYYIMVLKLIGNSEKSAHLRNNLCYLICSRHVIRSEAVTNQIFFLSEKNFIPSAQHVLSYHVIQVACYNILIAAEVKGLLLPPP